jgi:hypothetical protein
MYAEGMEDAALAKLRERAGLCADCVNSRRIESDRGSMFFLCELSNADPRFPKYPRLPVLACSGYRRQPAH